jgi:hypothetical protein
VRVVPYDFDTEVSFEIAESSLGKIDYDTNPPRIFRDPSAVKALERLAAALRDEGYNLDTPRPGKACQAFCSYSPAPDRKINIMLFVEGRTQESLQCWLSTFYSQPFIYQLLRRDLLASPQFMEVWRNLCGDIDRGLKETLAARSVIWDRLRPY